MKTTFKFGIAALGLLMAACSSDDAVPTPETTASTTNIRSVDEAIAVANNIACIFARPDSRSAEKVASGKSISIISSAPKSRSNRADTLIYIVNYENESGYAIIAANKNIDPFLGYVEEGSYSTEKVASNNGFQIFMNAAKGYTQTLGISGPDSGNDDIPLKPTPMFYEYTQYYNDTITPRVNVKWGQAYPEGILFKNKLAGCVQTAILQLLSAFEEPKSIQLTYPEREQNSLELNWATLNKHIKSTYLFEQNEHKFYCMASEEAHATLSMLSRQIGYMNDADDSQDETSATMSKAYSTVKQLLPNHGITSILDMSSQVEETIYLNIKDNNGIAFMTGSYLTESNQLKGHAWLLDGVTIFGSIHVVEYTTPTIIGSDKPQVVKTRNLETAFHYNWGDNGNCNGYFLPDVFMPNNAKNYDDPYEFNSFYGNYNVDVKFFVVSNLNS